MARPIRIDLPGGWYHVVNRGIERREIFGDETSFEHFLELLSEMPERFAIRIHGFVLMPNHYHLQLETPRANLSKAIQWLNVSYSVWYNRRHRRVGPLFQGRFKAILHEKETQGATINRYLHLNPVRVKALGGHEGRAETGKEITREIIEQRVKALKEYRWSSYRYYTGSIKSPKWMSTEAILAFFNGASERARRDSYRRELEKAAGLGRWDTDWKKEVKAMLLVGSDRFVDRMKGLLKGDRREQTGLRQVRAKVLSWKQVTRAVSKVWDTEWEIAKGSHGSGALAAALYVSRHHSDRSLRELGELAGGMQYPAVTMAIRRLEKRLPVDRTLTKRVNRVLKMLQIKT